MLQVVSASPLRKRASSPFLFFFCRQRCCRKRWGSTESSECSHATSVCFFQQLLNPVILARGSLLLELCGGGRRMSDADE